MKRGIALLASVILLVTVCASDDALAKKKNRKSGKELQRTLYDYSSTVHWSEFDKAVQFLDPAWVAEHPVSDLDMARFKQIQVSGYDVRTTEIEPDGSYDQVVEIRLINVNTQTERMITDHQHWRWDDAAKHWWLTSGLPDVTASDD
jgi:hypothetical protein